MGPQIHVLAFVFIKWTPFEFGFYELKLFKNFKTGQFWADWQTRQYVQNSPQYGAQIQDLGFFSLK